MKRFFAILAAAVLFAAAQAADTTPQEQYIKDYRDIAVSEMQRTGVPASITLAQGIIESDSGRSTLARDANNHFGIKCHRDWKGRTVLHDDDARNECFRAYDSPLESFSDHSDFLRYHDRYKDLFELKPTDYKGWARSLKKAGYATDPDYASKLIKVIEQYKLYEFDTVTDVPEPTPNQLQASKPVLAEGIPEFSEQLTISLTRPVFERNGSRYVLAVEGDTYASLADTYNLFFNEILRFNDLQDDEVLAPGTEVFIKAKAKYAREGLDKYVVGSDDEKLREICQRFGVKMSSIRKLNRFDTDFEPLEGDTILLRKVK